MKKGKYISTAALRVVSIALALLFVLSAFMTGSFAWAGMNQSALNEAKDKADFFPVRLEKYEKNLDGIATTIPISGAEFYLYTDSGEQIGGRYITDENGYINIQLPCGSYYFEETDPSDNYTYDKDDSGNEIRRFPFLVTGEDKNITIIKAYNRPIVGDLIITKTVKNADESALTQQQLNTEFEFTVNFSDNGSYAYKIDSTEYILKSGGTLRLKHGEKAVFANLPKGLIYTVTETPAAGCTTQSENHQGTITSSSKTAAFINTYEELEPGEITITVSKTLEGNFPEEYKDFKFSFILKAEGKAPVEFKLKAGETISFTLPNGAAYTINEIDLPEGVSLIKVINGTGTAIDGIAAEFVNKYTDTIYTEIKGEKTWEYGQFTVDLPSSIVINLKNGEITVATKTVKPDENGKWIYIFTNIPKYDKENNEIKYTIEENPIDGWKVSYNGYDVINTYIPPVAIDSIDVEKIITGSTPEKNVQFRFMLLSLADAPMPDASEEGIKTITVTGAGKGGFGSIIYRTPGVYVYTITEINTGEDGYTYDESVYTLTVTVAEQNGKLVIASKTLTKSGKAAEKAVFSNEYNPDLMNIRVTKAWQDNGKDRPESVSVQLYKNGTAYGEPVELNAKNNWTYLWTGLEKKFKWTVDEINVAKGYKKTVSGDEVNGFVITNTKLDEHEKTSVSVKKEWDDNENANRPNSVSVQLYKNGVAYGSPVTLNAANNWQYTWRELDKEFVWTVDEINTPAGYAKIIKGNAEDGFIITNSKNPPKPGQTTISGKKTWNHKNNSESLRPKSIILYIKADGEIIIQKQITEAQHWAWSVRVDKYAEDGHEIVYTVDEARIYNYSKKIDGYNIHNTYHSGTNTDDPNGPANPGTPGDPNAPQTGDNSNVILWLILMISSFIGLVVTIILRKRKTAYIPKH